MPFKAYRLAELPDLIVVERASFPDERGYFAELFRPSELLQLGVAFDVVQLNLSLSRRGVVRGLHFQRDPYAQAKYVAVLRGRVVDVAVDVRPGSRTFGRWAMVELSAENGRALYIPRGFAHGFQALEDDTLVLYAVDNVYAPHAEAGIRWDDPELNIPWPIRDGVIISKKDSSWPTLREALRQGLLDPMPPGSGP